MSGELDQRVRLAAFQWLRAQVDVHGEVLPRSILAEGFQFDGRRVPLLGPQGIFKPEMVARIGRYRRRAIDIHGDQVGCLVLLEPFFLDEAEWIAPPAGYDSDIGEGARIWGQVQLALARRMPMEHAVAAHRYGKPILVHPRLGQGAFRLLVTGAYGRRCAVTGERTLPVLDAAHIKPYAASGPHELRNGLLLRKDLHALFDAGYVTVTPSLELRVSRRIREEFENGRDYYALEGASVRVPLAPPPSPEYLEWHAESVFRG